MQQDRAKALQALPLFSALPESKLLLLTRLCVRVELDPEEILFLEGDVCRGLYVVESGLLKLYKVSPDGREQVLATYGPGCTLSELPMIDGGTYPFCSAAIAPSAVLFIPRAIVRRFCRFHTECAHEMLRIVAKRLRGALSMIEELSFSTVRTRLVAYLLRMVIPDKGAANVASLYLPASHEIAAEIGTVRELVSRNLSRLQATGVIRINRRTVLIPDVRLLAEEIGGASCSAADEARDTDRQTAVTRQFSRSERSHRIRASAKSGACSTWKSPSAPRV